MGSDSVLKISKSRLKRKNAALVALFLLFTCVMISMIVQSPENASGATFAPDVSRLPPQCHAMASRFHQCQQQSTKTRWYSPTMTANTQTQSKVVLACHRKWCNSFGHCEPCAGIGDRTRFGLSLVTEALNQCIRVEIDYPQPGLQLSSDALYEDPAGWVADWFHFRSYHNLRTVNISDWQGKTSFVHFTPEGFQRVEYDACLFHTLFQPAPMLQRQITHYRTHFGPNVIGIHFRTGDATSFGVLNKDYRVASVETSFTTMMECAHQLANRLFPNKDVMFFLATDNTNVKKLASNLTNVYMTDIQPRPYLKSEHEMSAWVELYLLSYTHGLVMNRRANKDYKGKGSPVSTFARLAQKIGFIPEDHVKICNV